MPSCKNVMSNAVTSERLKHENQEQIRQKELQSLRTTGKLIYPEHQTTIMTMPNILTIVEKSKIANKQPYSRMHEIHRVCIAKMSEYVGWRMEQHSKIRKICLSPNESELSVLYETQADRDSELSRVFCMSTGNLLNAMSEPHRYDVTRHCMMGIRRSVDMCFLADPNSSMLALCSEGGMIVIRNPIGMGGFMSGEELSERSKIYSLREERSLMLCFSSGLTASAFGTKSSVVVLEHLMEGRHAEQHRKFNTSCAAIHSIAFASTVSVFL